MEQPQAPIKAPVKPRSVHITNEELIQRVKSKALECAKKIKDLGL